MVIIKTDTAILNFDNITQIYTENFDDQSRLYAQTNEGADILIDVNTPTEISEKLDAISCCLEMGFKVIKI